MQAARAALGPSCFLAGDANGAWQTSQARDLIANLSEAGLDLIEQPVAGIAEFASLGELPGILIGIDEDSSAPEAFDRPKVADVCCIKLQSCGGIDRMIEQAASARAVGMKVLLGSTLDGPIGIAAALHAACVIQPDLPCGLATISNIAEASQLNWIESGAMRAPQGPGLGVQPAWRHTYRR